MIKYWEKIILESWAVFTKNYILLLGAQILLYIIYLYPSTEFNNAIMGEVMNYEISLSKLILFIALTLLYLGIYIGSIFITHHAVSNKKIVFKNLFQHFHILHLIVIPRLALGILFMLLLTIGANFILALFFTTFLYCLLFFFYDFLIIMEGSTLQEISEFVSEFASMENISKTATHVILKTYKENGVPFINPTDKEKRLPISP